MRYLAPLIGLLFFSAAAVDEPASAQPNRAREGVRSGEVLSLDQILPGIRRQYPGSLADVEGPSIGPDGEPHYRLKWLTPDGRVQWLDTNARTGQLVPSPGPQRRPPPPSASDQRRNFGPPPEAYGPPPRPEFGQPGGPPSRFRPPPRESFPGGPDPRFSGRPPRPEQQQFMPGVPPPPNFDRPPPPRNFGRPPPPRDFDRPPPRGRGDLGREPPPRPRSNFNDGGANGFRRPPPPPRAPDGEPRGPRRFR